MSTTPVAPVTIQSEVAALAHRHLSLTFGLVGTLVLMMVLMGFGGYLGLKAFDAQLARQELKDAQYQQDRTTFLSTLQAHDAERLADAKKIAELEAQIKQRDSKPLPPAVDNGLKPDATLPEVEFGLRTAFNDVPGFNLPLPLVGPYIELTAPQAQAVTRSKVEGDKAKGDLGDQKSINSLLDSANSSLTNDLNSCKALNVQANKDIAGYKKLAVRSRWQKFVGGMEKVLIFGAGAYMGHKI